MDPAGSVSVAIRVTDSQGVSQTTNITIAVAAAPTPEPEPTPTPVPAPLSINLSGCSDVNTACNLPGAPVGGLYQYALTASGGGTGTVTWAFEPAAPGGALAWLTLSTSGILQGTVPPTCGQIGNPFFIKVTKGSETVIRKVQIIGVTGPSGTC